MDGMLLGILLLKTFHILPVVNGEELIYEIDSLGNSMDIDLEIYLIK